MMAKVTLVCRLVVKVCASVRYLSVTSKASFIANITVNLPA